VKRGEVWTLAGGLDYAGKPRPALILQDDRFDATESVTVCPFTTHSEATDVMRLAVEPDEANGLRTPCRLMVDKIITVPKSRIGRRIGRLDVTDMARVGRAVVVFLGLADASSR
jgi:mRNA interferase MazF